MIGPLSVQEAREQIAVRLREIDDRCREIDELWQAVVYVEPDVRRPLTDQQRAVARRMAFSGMSASQVAREMWLSENTVRTHIRLAYRALGIRRRSQLRDALIAAERVPEAPAAGVS